MIAKFIAQYAKLIVQEPDKISVVKEDINESYSEITIYASNLDAGKLIGKDGKMIGAIKTLITGCKAKDGISYKVQVNNIDKQR
jgi:predicted RNA-binding protein YlqC (UPF0109 family)